MLCQATFKYLRERAETLDKNPFWYWGDFNMAGVNDARPHYTFWSKTTSSSSIIESNVKMLLIYPRECLNKTPRSANTIVYY